MPTKKKSVVPPLSDWNMFAGGLSAAPGKRSYELVLPGTGTLSIDPISSERGAHLGYSLRGTYLLPGSLHQTIHKNGHIGPFNGVYRADLFRTPSSAVVAARNALVLRAVENPSRAKLRNPAQRERKTVDIIVLQGNYGYGHGWEDESTYDVGERKAAVADIKEYRASGSGGSYRLIRRRVLRSDPSKAAR
jgi:hypothetical protein